MGYTTITFDPRIDLPGGGTTPLAVTIKATPLMLRTEGTATVYPSNLTYTDITAATPFVLNSTDGTWAWSIGVYDTSAQRARVIQHRVVAVTGTMKQWTALVDVDPDTFVEGTPGPAWLAVIESLTARITALEAGGVTPPPTPGTYMTTESGETLTTESGDLLLAA